MGFIAGLFIGAMAASGGSTALPPMLGSIPLRCLAAFDISDAEYRMCRSQALQHEIHTSAPWCDSNDIKRPDGPCSYEKHITWEIAGLRSLKQAVESKQSVVK